MELRENNEGPPLRAAAVLLAAGASRRMRSDGSKALLSIGGRSVVERSAAALLAAASVDELVVVTRPEDREAIEAALQPHAHAISAFVDGGDQRTDSVRFGVRAVSARADVILVHDAARCFVNPIHVNAVARAAYEHGAALLATRVRDTLKLSRNGFQSEETVDRDQLWAAQTPQAMRTARFLDVLMRSEHDRFLATDDAALHEHYHGPTKLVEGSSWNIKLTTPDDLELGEALAGRDKKS
ncbi:MAG: 2-C-methyl-D-erythritol 4-phosphate cytidylyltransferase [Paracoccaceae bacterium]|jgi:2-C-methyl-D-erythritol 4-phosphate cytidylyltransferase